MIDRREEYDSARLLTRAALVFVSILILFVCIIIGIQIYKTGTANTESWAALTGLIGWVQGVNSSIYNARYGTTLQSSKKDAVILQQAQTAAVVQAALPVVPANGGTIQADNVAVKGDNVVVTKEK